MLREHASDLGEFLTQDSKGRQLADYMERLAEHLSEEQASLLREMELIRGNVEHINDIVSVQQSYARLSGFTEEVEIVALIEDALRMNAGSLARNNIEIIRDFEPGIPPVTVEKHKVLQILVNLIRNAKLACEDSGRKDKQLTVALRSAGAKVRAAFADNGVGIPRENLTRIFSHGFTTRKNGHGFGLHNSALAAKEMGGSLTAESDGPGCGATFILELPIRSSPGAAATSSAASAAPV